MTGADGIPAHEAKVRTTVFPGTFGVVTTVIFVSSLILNLHVGIIVCLGGLNPLEKHCEKQNHQPDEKRWDAKPDVNGILSSTSPASANLPSVISSQQRKTEPPP
tara:strand:+ start:289 stop:603 length:315 start_codon:yes stop_codon:yes gene_type:complete